MFEQLPEAEEMNLKIVEAKFPRIADKLRMSWGTPQGKAYLDSLIVDERGGRTGFPFDVFAALMELQTLHKLAHVDMTRSIKKDPWQNTDK